jgi:hypothetical protein
LIPINLKINFLILNYIIIIIILLAIFNKFILAGVKFPISKSSGFIFCFISSIIFFAFSSTSNFCLFDNICFGNFVDITLFFNSCSISNIFSWIFLQVSLSFFISSFAFFFLVPFLIFYYKFLI